MSPPNKGSDYVVSQPASIPRGFEVQFKRIPNAPPVGVNNIMPDTEMKGLLALQGNGTIFTHPSPMNGPSLYAGQVQPVMATFDAAGQITFGTTLAGTTAGAVDPNAPLVLENGGPY
jgi:hypothetical protein